MQTFKSANRLSLAALVLVLAAACGQQQVAKPAVEQLQSPAPAASMGPNLAVSPGGEVYLSWLEQGADDAHALRYAKLNGVNAKWSAPVTIVERPDLLANWADFPSLLPMPSGRLVAHWLQNRGDGPFAYDVRMSQSVDDGKTWSEGVVLHDDGEEAEHGFVSLIAPPDGDVQAIWLDGRKTVAPDVVPEMQLAFTTLSANGSPAASQMIDTRICDCCQTSAAWASTGPVVVYRDRTPDEIRDISILRRVDGVWTGPKTVHADNWQIEGCPVNGPSIAARDNLVAAAWYTGANGVERVNVAFSQDSGATFAAPIQVDDGAPAGRVSVVLSATGEAHVLWLERGENEAADIRLRTVSADGARSEAVVIAKTSAAKTSGFPRMATAGDDLIVAWTEVSEPMQVRVARVRP